MNDYDVYHQWLGIPPEDQPPTLYDLLGVACFERDLDVIRRAAGHQSMQVRRLAEGEFAELGCRLLNEIAEARLCLINPARREAYDLALITGGTVPAGTVLPTAKSKSAKMLARGSVKGTVEEIVPTSMEAIYINIAPMLAGQPRQNRWVIGYDPKCDFRIDSPVVSSIHCEVIYTSEGAAIADLNSTNGTYVNQKRIHSPHSVRRQDLITLGRDKRILLPGHLMAGEDSHGAIFVGKGAGNEIQLESPTVSLFHARIIPSGTAATVEDLHSKNGTFLQRGDGKPIRIQRCRLHVDDTLYFGSVSVQAHRLLTACGAA